ncbi:MAG: ribbon-helix-helix protein, CopG family [Burkholderiales bacterium]
MNVRLNVNITEALNSRLDELAAKDGTTKSELLRKAIALIDLAVTERGQGNKLAITDSQHHVLREIIGV